MNSIEVCLSPVLFPFRTTHENYIVVIVDVLRATSAFCAAFDSGAKTVIPVSGLEELLEYKNKGLLTAAERDGEKVDFADFGNSPTVFSKSDLRGKELAYSTTNGTQAIEIARAAGSEHIVAAAFVNLFTVSEWLINQQMNVVILCAGWKNTFSFEDTLCAGSLVESLELSGIFHHSCDASAASLSLWKSSENDLGNSVAKADHYQRLIALGQQNDLKFCFRLNSSKALPVWNGYGFRDITDKNV
jgi:2-phosphosulfolactate phosphatase